MKKLLATFGAILLGLSLTSCGKKIDSSNWISSLDDAKTAASKENKHIILAFSAFDSDDISERLAENVLRTSEFTSKYTADYVLCTVDFSNSRFDVMSPDPNAEDSNPKETEKLRDILNKDMKLASLYAVQSLPTYYLLTKEGYVVSKLNFEADYDMDKVSAEIEKNKAQTEMVDELLSTIKTGKKDQVIEAIDKLFMCTEFDSRVLLADFNEKLVKLDKKNESGLVVKHLFALSDAKAQIALLEEDFEKAVKALEEPAKSEFLSPEDKQQVYYTAGYLLASSGSTDFPRVKDYFQKALDAAPEGEHAEAIKYAINYIDEMSAEGTSTVEGPASAPVSGEPAENTEVSAPESSN